MKRFGIAALVAATMVATTAQAKGTWGSYFAYFYNERTAQYLMLSHETCSSARASAEGWRKAAVASERDTEPACWVQKVDKDTGPYVAVCRMNGSDVGRICQHIAKSLFGDTRNLPTPANF